MSDLRRVLEEAIVAHPDDLSAHLAYADYLAEQGDPRGELIQVQLAREGTEKGSERDRELLHRERMLMTHERQWLGELAAPLLDKNVEAYRHYYGLIHRWSWWRGWLEEVHCWQYNRTITRALARCPMARILRRLSLGETGYETNSRGLSEEDVPSDAEFPALYPLQKAPFLDQLIYFRLGEEVNFDQGSYNCRTYGEGVDLLIERMSRVQELHLLAREMNLERIFSLQNLTSLRTLVVYHHAETYPVDILARNAALVALETLRLHPAHTEEEEGYLPLEVVRELLHSRQLPSLKHLHLHASSMGDRGCAEIVGSGILRRLETLDLRYGCVSDEGVRLLLSSLDIRGLKSIYLDNNELTEVGCRLLEESGLPDISCESQAEPGSGAYLFSGDME